MTMLETRPGPPRPILLPHRRRRQQFLRHLLVRLRQPRVVRLQERIHLARTGRRSAARSRVRTNETRTSSITPASSSAPGSSPSASSSFASSIANVRRSCVAAVAACSMCGTLAGGRLLSASPSVPSEPVDDDVRSDGVRGLFADGASSDSQALGSCSAFVLPMDGRWLTCARAVSAAHAHAAAAAPRTHLVLPDRLPDLVRDPVEHLLVVVRHERRQEPVQEPALRLLRLRVRRALEPERRRQVRLEERLEQLVRQHDHPEPAETDTEMQARTPRTARTWRR